MSEGVKKVLHAQLPEVDMISEVPCNIHHNTLSLTLAVSAPSPATKATAGSVGLQLQHASD